VSALDRLPVDSPFRLAGEALRSPDPKARREVLKHLKPFLRPMWEAPVQLEEPVVLAVLDVVFETPFPPPASEWEQGPEQLVFALLGNVTPPALARLEAGVATADQRLRLELLTIALSARTREAAQTVVRLVQRHGWPRRFHARFFHELSHHAAHAEVLYPALLEVPGGPEVNLVDGLLQALRAGTYDVLGLKGSALESNLAARLETLRLEASGLDDAAAEARSLYAALLELAGFVGGADVVKALHASLSVGDPWPVTFGVVSLVRRNEPVAAEVFSRLGAVDHVRVPLYELLGGLGKRHLLPASARTRQAFAAAEMVGWLAHPNELGRPPAALELMERARFEHEGRPVEVFLWRFLDSKQQWLAATSGPYPLDAPEGPLAGNLTFSKFERWDARDPQGHLESIRTTLAAWAAAKR
jgi:hypothetical protein